MQLTRAFSLGAHEVVAFVGGGGKTTAMFRLAGELVAAGQHVVTTTTTRIFASQIQLAPYHLFVEDPRRALDEILAALARQPHVLVIGATDGTGKAFGVEPELVDELAVSPGVDAVLVEADGSRARPFKAPAAHEPVLPGSTTLLVPVVGVETVGLTLDAAHVHRPELVASLAELASGAVLDEPAIARVLAHAQGGLKARPPHARAIPLVNKVVTTAQLASARRIAHRLLETREIEAVALGAVRHAENPVVELRQRVAAVVLAAGGSTRMGGDVKQLLPWGDSTLVRHAVAVAQAADVSEIVVVTGSRAEEVGEQLRGTPARLVYNPDWTTGRASSVRAGIIALDPLTAGALFINADQPFLTPAVLDELLAHFASDLAPVIVPTYDGEPGSPVLFARSVFPELASLQGEQGGRELLQKYTSVLARVPIADARAATDLDTPAEYEAARSGL